MGRYTNVSFCVVPSRRQRRSLSLLARGTIHPTSSKTPTVYTTRVDHDGRPAVGQDGRRDVLRAREERLSRRLRSFHFSDVQQSTYTIEAHTHTHTPIFPEHVYLVRRSCSAVLVL